MTKKIMLKMLEKSKSASYKSMYKWKCRVLVYTASKGERGGSVVECRTPEREVGGSKPTAAVLCP